MRKSIWQKRIPTLLGLLLILVGLGITTYLVKTGVIVVGRASSLETPENIRITNVSDTSFTVSFTTDKETVGTLSYGALPTLGTVILDDRDQQSKTVLPYKTHYITVRNLNPSTKYFFSLASGQNNFLHDGNPFEVITGPSLSPSSLNQNITGTVLLPDGTKPVEAIAYVKTPHSQTLSTFITNDGTFTISLNAIRTEDLSSYVNLSEGEPLQVLVLNDSLQSEVIIPKTETTIPTITLSHNYDFTSGDPESTESAQPEATASSQTHFPIFSVQTAPSSAQITSPKTNEEFIDQRPVFKGTANPGSTVKVTIESSEKIDAQVTADSKGNWSYRPTKALSPGAHTITIATTDRLGILHTISQTFTVFAQGSQVQESATPSATPTVRITAIPTFTPIPTLLEPSPTIEPTLIPSPTEVILSPTPTSPAPSPIETLLNVGNSSQIIGGVAALVTTGVGVILLMLSIL